MGAKAVFILCLSLICCALARVDWALELNLVEMSPVDLAHILGINLSLLVSRSELT